MYCYMYVWGVDTICPSPDRAEMKYEVRFEWPANGSPFCKRKHTEPQLQESIPCFIVER